MLTLKHPSYRFHATAVAISGSITRPLQRDFKNLVWSELPDGAGGYFADRREKHRIEEILSFDTAYAHVTGTEGPDGTFNTLAIATVENLNILDMVKIGRVTSRLTGMHKKDDLETMQHPWIIPLGSEIEGLRIAGKLHPVQHPAEFHVDPTFTYAAWKAKPHHKAIPGTVIEVPRFGTITLCNLEMDRETKPKHVLHRLTMVRFDLGSPVDGQLEIGTTIEDGGTPPP